MLYKVCREGKGESIWTGMQFGAALRMMEEMAREKQEKELAEEYRILYDEQKKLVNTIGWDGAWYRRCITDKGMYFGCAKEEQAKIWLNIQSWAVISGEWLCILPSQYLGHYCGMYAG